MPTLYQIITIALFCVFLELAVSKTGLRDKLRDKFDALGIGIISEMLECDFCFGFWLSVLVSVIMFFYTLDPAYMVVPFFAAPVIRFLV